MRDYRSPWWRNSSSKGRKSLLTPTGATVAMLVAAAALIAGCWLGRHVYQQAKKPLPMINSHQMNGALRFQAKEMTR